MTGGITVTILVAQLVQPALEVRTKEIVTVPADTPVTEPKAVVPATAMKVSLVAQ
jgi:hypothetical protein